ncbi:beta-mannanase [Acetivibrio clariflavus DSM 19732]|uniref:Beta-mannanase n=2 Tax=Acetivibrio clariflavus TaxID=288965 RepID=G8LVM3_ACECE|nr:beta-mannanase [Acetivibrio clariflavus DSM 19732]
MYNKIKRIEKWGVFMLKNRKQSILMAILLLLGLTLFPITGNSAETELKIGAWLGSQPTDAGIKELNQLQGRNLDIVHMFINWSTNFDFVRPHADAVYANNAILLITWEPWEYDTVQIMNGNADSYIRRMAQDMKYYGKEIWLRPLHEANGDWYPWAIGYAGGKNTNSTYIAAFRRIVDIFRSEGANNVKWVFNVNCNNVGPNTSFTGIYPGDNYVDYTSIDGYNWGTTQSWGSKWQSFDEIFSEAYNSLRNYNKPIIIAEWASAEIGGNKAQWITDSFNRIKSSYDKIFAAVWFNHNKETDWRINSSEAALNAYRNAIKKTSATPTATQVLNPTPTPSSAVIYGDVNQDGTFNSIDYGFLKMYLLGMVKEDSINKQAADVDGNGTIDSIDFAYMKMHLLGMINKFPVQENI